MHLKNESATFLAVSKMQSKWIVVECLAFLITLIASQEISNLTFPDSFLFGAASSAYQIEGAWNASGKGPSRWDYLARTARIIEDGSTGDVAADSYHRYKEDIIALKELGVNFYRFSISWARILPRGFVNEINPDGVQYYNNLINGLLAEGIEPWVTMHHYDVPLPLQYLGGWNNPKIVEYFTDYANLLFQLFGDRVKTWLTLNEPYIFCAFYVKITVDATEKQNAPTGITEYLCGHNMLRAHAKVYRLYEQKYKRAQKGRVTIVLNLEYPISRNDPVAAKRKRDFDLGWSLHPLVYGDYPQVMIDTIGNYSSTQGFQFSRLPKFTIEEKAEIKGAYDFIAINHYSSGVAVSKQFDITTTSFENDCCAYMYPDSSWEKSALDWLTIYPQGFRELLIYIKENYGNPEIAVTEQGFADEPNTLNDTGRIRYYKLYLNEVLKAIYEDEVRVIAYTAWSLLDSFEWVKGYMVAFGLYHIDFKNENRTRTPKESAKFFKNVTSTRSLIDSSA